MKINKESLILVLFSGTSIFALQQQWLSPAVFCLSVIGFMLLALVKSYPPELTVLSALAIILLGSEASEEKFLSLKAAFHGFSESSVITIGALFVVAGAVNNSGIFDKVAHKTLGEKACSKQAIARMALPVGTLSAFLNNTPIVTIFMPIVMRWAHKKHISPSKLLIPLSYLTAFGGVCTLIGTSTNLQISGLLESKGMTGIGMFELAKVALPCAILGILYLVFVGEKLLPLRREQIESTAEVAQKYLSEVTILNDSPLIDQSLGDSGLRDLDDLFLLGVRRGQHSYAPIRRDFVFEDGDQLVFVGSIKELSGIMAQYKFSEPNASNELALGQFSELLEIVIPQSSPLIGKTVAEVYFNRKYDASVLALHRNGKDMVEGMSTTPLKRGDTLLLLAGFGLRKIWQNSNDFILLSSKEEEAEKDSSNVSFTLALLTLMIAIPLTTSIPIQYTALPTALLLIANHVVDIKACLNKYIDWKVLLVIASSFGLSAAIQGSGASSLIADQVTKMAHGSSPLVALFIIYLITNIMTEMITNNAAAAIMFPIALSTAEKLGVSYVPFIMCMAIAASASFATPIGYQTNMIVLGPGNYTYKDYFKVGLPLNIMFCIVACLLAQLVWPF